MPNFEELSRQTWTPALGSNVAVEQIACGALQRIANATEKMAKHHATLIEERDRYKRYYEEQQTANQREYRRTIALRGVITKLRKALAREREQRQGT